jgi:hypothetical protein
MPPKGSKLVVSKSKVPNSAQLSKATHASLRYIMSARIEVFAAFNEARQVACISRAEKFNAVAHASHRTADSTSQSDAPTSSTVATIHDQSCASIQAMMVMRRAAAFTPNSML